jgi:zinc transport system substrate-binding protein
MLIDEIKEHKISLVFYLQFSSRKVADNICKETGAEAYSIHTCHNVTKEEFDKGESYVSLMRVNYEHIKIALGK